MGMVILAGLVVFGLSLWGTAVFVKKRKQRIQNEINAALDGYNSAIKYIDEADEIIRSNKRNRAVFVDEAARMKIKLERLGVKVD